jgi:hypothetical protein
MNNGLLAALMGMGGGLLLVGEASGIESWFEPAAKLTGVAAMLVVTLAVLLKVLPGERQERAADREARVIERVADTKARNKMVSFMMLMVRHCPGVSQEAIDKALADAEEE